MTELAVRPIDIPEPAIEESPPTVQSMMQYLAAQVRPAHGSTHVNLTTAHGFVDVEYSGGQHFVTAHRPKVVDKHGNSPRRTRGIKSRPVRIDYTPTASNRPGVEKLEVRTDLSHTQVIGWLGALVNAVDEVLTGNKQLGVE